MAGNCSERAGLQGCLSCVWRELFSMLLRPGLLSTSKYDVNILIYTLPYSLCKVCVHSYISPNWRVLDTCLGETEAGQIAS